MYDGDAGPHCSRSGDENPEWIQRDSLHIYSEQISAEVRMDATRHKVLPTHKRRQ